MTDKSEKVRKARVEQEKKQQAKKEQRLRFLNENNVVSEAYDLEQRSRARAYFIKTKARNSYYVDRSTQIEYLNLADMAHKSSETVRRTRRKFDELNEALDDIEFDRQAGRPTVSDEEEAQMLKDAEEMLKHMLLHDYKVGLRLKEFYIAMRAYDLRTAQAREEARNV